MDILQSKSSISFTPTAIAEIVRLANKEDAEKILRVGVKDGGCAGFSYIFEFDSKNSDDIVFEIDELKYIVDSNHLEHIKNLTIDYQSGLNNRGFTFTNPDASTTCGCGTSFA